MKHIMTLLFALGIIATAFPQSPNNMSYQAVIRDAGDVLITTTVGMQISILQGSTSGSAVYSETHTPTPNNNGLISLEIGNGSVVSGDITSIDWSSGPYFLKVESDPLGGTLYTIIGINEILSVPYARHAKTAESVAGLSTTGVSEGTNLYYTEARVSANTAVAANTAKTGITAGQALILTNTSGTNTGDQDLSGIATNATAISNLSTTGVTEGTNLYYTEARVSANTAVAGNTAKTGITAGQALILTNTSGTNTGDQDLSGIATNATAISNLSTTGVTEGANLYYTEARVSANTAVAANTAKTGITAGQALILTNTSGTNTGDQNISGIATNATAISNLSTTGVTEGTNLYYTEARVGANTAVAANTAKTGITNGQALILTNTSGTNTGDQNISGIATNATAISNLSTTGVTEGTNLYYTEGRVGANTAVAANTAKTGITAGQALILTNTSGTNTGDQNISGIATNATAINLKANIASPTFTGTVTTPALNIPTGAGADKVLTSDASGNATWQSSSSTKSSAVTYFNNNNSTWTSISDQNIPKKITATYLSEELSDFTHVGGKLTYTGSSAKKFVINTNLSMYSTENDKKCTVYIYLNGVKVAKTAKRVSSGKAYEGTNASTMGVIQMTTNDYIEIYVENNESEDYLRVVDMYCLVTEF